MGVDHELCQRAVYPCQGSFQHDEPRAGSFRGGFEIHRRRDAGDLEMLFRGEIKLRHVAPAVHFDIVGFVCAVGRIISGQVGDARQHIGQLRVEILGLCLHGGDFGFLVADQCAQTLKFGLVALGLGSAHELGGFVLVRLCGFSC